MELLYYRKNGAVLAPGVASELMLLTEGWEPVYRAEQNRPEVFQVMSERCDACLFTRDRLTTGETAAAIISRCRSKGTHFICHKAGMSGDPNGKNVCCHEFYHRAGDTAVVQLAKTLKVVKFVDVKS